jgi:hypothetical protein
VYCKKHKATLFSKICIRRQEIAKERKITEEKLSSFAKCYDCKYGKKILKIFNSGYANLVDKDIRKIYNEKVPKPKRVSLKISKKKKLKIKDL